MTIPVFVGHDHREAVAYHVFCQSVLANTKAPVAFYPISGEQRDGSNSFIYGRFNAARRAGYKGRVIYADSDMLLRDGADIEELYELADSDCAVTVAQHNYRTRFPVKYWGQPNEDYPRKNWSSLMVIEAGHEAWRQLDVAERGGADLHRFVFLGDDGLIGVLPLEWNWLVGEYDFKPDVKLAHFTLGIPPHFDYGELSPNAMPFVLEWWRAFSKATWLTMESA